MIYFIKVLILLILSLFINFKETNAFVKSLLGTRLVTYQTDANGQPVHAVIVEETSDIARELYLGAVVDRAKKNQKNNKFRFHGNVKAIHLNHVRTRFNFN